MPSSSPLTRSVRIETPEHVVLEYELAGLGSRGAAALVDQLAILLVLAALMLLNLFARRWGLPQEAAFPVLLLAGFSIWYGYYTFFEGLRSGQTPGKRLLGLRVVMETGHPVTLGAAAVRNLLRTADFLPPPYLLGAALIAIHPRNRRLGDLAAGTVVVRDQPHTAHAGDVPASAPPTTRLDTPQLKEPEFALLENSMHRLHALDAAAAERVGAALVHRFAFALPDDGSPPTARLARLLDDEVSRRAGTAPSPALELVQRQAQRWQEFEPLAQRAQRQGLDQFAAAQLPDFAARYREIAADLARLHTYGASRDTIARVERLVASGHNALYRTHRHNVGALWRVLAIECPAAAARSWRYVLIAAVTFLVPGMIGFGMIRERPAIAEEVLPSVMLERAEAGTRQAARGERYVSVAVEGRPFTASWIITNNVRVALLCFAGGIFVGLGALVLLAFNGLQLGATAAHFTNAGLGAYLGEFILGHGMLELTAIWIAGGAGFLLGTSFMLPGRMSRANALRAAAQRALRMLGAAVVCLVVAGVIEGFVSTSDVAWAGRGAASVLSMLFLLGYVLTGAARARRLTSPE